MSLHTAISDIPAGQPGTAEPIYDALGTRNCTWKLHLKLPFPQASDIAQNQCPTTCTGLDTPSCYCSIPGPLQMQNILVVKMHKPARRQLPATKLFLHHFGLGCGGLGCIDKGLGAFKRGLHGDNFLRGMRWHI